MPAVAPDLTTDPASVHAPLARAPPSCRYLPLAALLFLTDPDPDRAPAPDPDRAQKRSRSMSMCGAGPSPQVLFYAAPPSTRVCCRRPALKEPRPYHDPGSPVAECARLI